MQLEFTVPGRAIPAVRMTQRSKFTPRAQRYLAYKGQVGWIAKQHFQGQPTDKPIGISLTVYLCGGNQGDIDNYFKSIADSLNKIVYEDDRQIKIIKAIKAECTKDNERVEVKVYELDESELAQIS